MTEYDTCELWQPGRIDADGNPAPTDCPHEDHVHTVQNPFNHPDWFIQHRTDSHEAKERARPKFDHGLSTSAEMWRRERLHAAWRNEVNYYGVSEPYLLIPPFTEADLAFTTWRPWGKVESGDDVDLYVRRQAERFHAILDSIDREHEDQHWFYQHPFCRGCFPDHTWLDGEKVQRHSVVVPRLANWMLRNGERGFPAHTWDGVLPKEPEEPEEVENAWLTLDDLMNLEPPEWIIDGLVPSHSIGVISGPPNIGKSFLALDWSLRLASDGKRVLYLIGESPEGFAPRVEAWMSHHFDCDDEAIRENFIPRGGVVNMFEPGPSFDDLLERAAGADILFLDTLALASEGAEENSNSDMGKIQANLKRLHRVMAPDATVVVVAHTDATAKKIRGATSTNGAIDFDIRLSDQRDQVLVKAEKQRNGAKGEALMSMLPVEDSLVIVPADEAPEPIQWLSDSIKARVSGVLHATKEALTAPAVISATKDDGTGKPASKTAIYEALTELENEGTIERLPGARKNSYTYRYLNAREAS